MAEEARAGFTAHYQRSASCWGGEEREEGEVEEEEEDTPGTLSDLLLLPSRVRNFSPQRPKTVKTNRFSQLRKFGLFN